MLSSDINNLFSNYYTSTISDNRYYQQSQVYTKTETDNLLDYKQNIITSNPYGFNLLSTPQGAILNELKSVNSSSGITITNILDTTLTPQKIQLQFGIDSSVVALQTDITNINSNITNNYTDTTALNTLLTAKLDTTSFNTQIANYMLSTDINNALSNKVDNTTILNYMLSTDIALTLNNYLTATQISNTIYTKKSN